MPGGSPSGDSDSPVEDATGDSAVADPDVDEGGLDMAEARVTMEPSMTCVDGVFTCGICAYTTDKKANWYKHKVHHTGSVRQSFSRFIWCYRSEERLCLTCFSIHLSHC